MLKNIIIYNAERIFKVSGITICLTIGHQIGHLQCVFIT